MTTVEVLVAARARVAQGWTQRYYAVDDKGHDVAVNDTRACRWCMTGALYATQCSDIEVLCRAVSALEKAANAEHLAYYNDGSRRTQAEVVAVFDRAIAAQQERA